MVPFGFLASGRLVADRRQWDEKRQGPETLSDPFRGHRQQIDGLFQTGRTTRGADPEVNSTFTQFMGGVNVLLMADRCSPGPPDATDAIAARRPAGMGNGAGPLRQPGRVTASAGGSRPTLLAWR